MTDSLQLMPSGRIPVELGNIPELDLLELLGTGAFASVWKARDPRTHRLYALKVIQDLEPGSVLCDRVKLEAEVRIESPYIIPSVGLRQWDASTFLIVFDYYQAHSLDQWIAGALLTWEQKRLIFQQILWGVRDAHRHNIIHRDLKPSNVLVNSAHAVKIIDFGISKFYGKGMTRTGEVMGTPPYLPPEAFLQGSLLADARTDIYAIGHILYELEMGQHFWRRQGWSRLEHFFTQYLHQTPEPTEAIDLRDFRGQMYPNSREAIALMVKTQVAQRIDSVEAILTLLGLHDPDPTEIRDTKVRLGFPLLRVESGSNRDACLPINLADGETRSIGRGEIAGNDVSISRKHLFVRRYGTQYCAGDHGSTNGTLHNGRILAKGQSVWIKHGDHLKLGDVFLRVEFREDSPP
ncbi:FHA domain-containing serine/threonine-protein kinase [Lyngbya confervoides]|uniref:non-specific serine/threonine protein kinase n=1 Tax=Lyngbya confervoides BDU141951 TaxID=1574623 RepID=A0ABD4T3E9_9CYAN|nr:FHA domain-containing serine/threonine-protein kinase [Lyngbya confervoides]MCM1982840.1 FHA domain-containing serine/threonine-protein kinase [Lyngbya confervoides BDU141951]